MDRGTWPATAHGVKKLDTTERQTLSLSLKHCKSTIFQLEKSIKKKNTTRKICMDRPLKVYGFTITHTHTPNKNVENILKEKKIPLNPICFQSTCPNASVKMLKKKNG